MFVYKVTVGLLALLLLCSGEEPSLEDPLADLSVGERLERVNSNTIRSGDKPELIEGDIAVAGDNGKNADPCTSSRCKWPKSADGNVYIPYVIADVYNDDQRNDIQKGLDSFNNTCIRFIQRSNQKDYISIESINGCWSYVGRQGNKQALSLEHNGCVYFHTIQHELLHALGFHHEQTRSDRDSYIVIVWENIEEDKKYNFNKTDTLNQNTPYDYNSVMQYHKTAFSKNDKPTMIPIPNPNVTLGTATEMSPNDILRIKRLYNCCE
ncbi:low choriolytic enzyme-like isoform X3 [Neoarius graeffei]|uniref:low choriolytic enzyme-like isoform X3 n=1 Tax=Neoarius graeffei TaxID=443677 RepID=UPI00298D0337|nr:low choriolytic enzyme-like isoform X3 [Neoarius graeffei]